VYCSSVEESDESARVLGSVDAARRSDVCDRSLADARQDADVFPSFDVGVFEGEVFHQPRGIDLCEETGVVEVAAGYRQIPDGEACAVELAPERGKRCLSASDRSPVFVAAEVEVVFQAVFPRGVVLDGPELPFELDQLPVVLRCKRRYSVPFVCGDRP